MATREEIYAAIRNADKAGDTEAVRKLAVYLQSGSEQPAGSMSIEPPGMAASLGAGLGKGFGQVILNAQKYAGKGIRSLGELVSPDESSLTTLVTGQKKRGLVQSAGDWLVNDADQGLAKITGEAAPYKAAHPIIEGGGELGGNIVATLPVGGILAKGAGAIPGVSTLAPNLLASIRTSGMTAGAVAPGVGNAIANMATRAAGGAITGGVSAALVDPEQAKTGAIVGGAFPIVAKVAGEAGNAIGQKLSDLTSSASERLMQSAIKPTIKQLKSGDAQTAVRTLLDYGINPTQGGVNKLRALIDAKNAEIASEIAASGSTIDKGNVLSALGSVRQKFGNQVSPTADLNAIKGVADDFANHPLLPREPDLSAIRPALKDAQGAIHYGNPGQTHLQTFVQLQGSPKIVESGFATPSGQFLTRDEAGVLAGINGPLDASTYAKSANLPLRASNEIPVQLAQEMKQGTYRVLGGKYGQLGSAETEAQKALARGLKDEIATAVPAVGPLNAEESRLLTTLSVAERRALMEMNKNPMGLAALAHNPASWAMFMADKSALFKSLAARAVNSMADAPNAIQGALGNQAVQRVGYQAAPVALSAQ